MNILIIDDHAMVRDGFIQALLSVEDSWHIAGAGDADEGLAVLEAMKNDGGVDVLLLDIELKNNACGLDFVALFREKQPDIKILIVTMNGDTAYIRRAAHLDVQGFIMKDAPLASLVEAIKTVSNCGTWYSQNIALRMSTLIDSSAEDSEFAAYNRLTRREQEIFEHIARGENVEDISHALNINIHTVENHRTAVFSKLGLKDRLDVVNYARKLGLVS